MKCWLQADMILRPLVFQSMFFFNAMLGGIYVFIKSRCGGRFCCRGGGCCCCAIYFWSVEMKPICQSIQSQAVQPGQILSESQKEEGLLCLFSSCFSHDVAAKKKRWQGYDVISFNPYHTMSYHVYSMIIVEKYVCMLHMSYLGGASIMIKLFMYLGWFWYPP